MPWDSTFIEAYMSISGIGSSQTAAFYALLGTSGAGAAATTGGSSTESGSSNALVANIDLASSGVSAALESLSDSLGSLLNVTA
jgi:hypothetical protein